jgi:hypothetical protein
MLSPERSFDAPVIVSDADLEHFAELYLANPVFSRLGYSFESFLMLRAGLFGQARLMDLLDAAVRAAIRARQAAIDDVVRRLGAEDAPRVEKLRHRRWPRHADRRVFREVTES